MDLDIITTAIFCTDIPVTPLCMTFDYKLKEIKLYTRKFTKNGKPK